MFCYSPLWLVYAVKGTLFIVGLLVIILMQRAEKDQQINRVDSKNRRKARRISFMAVTGFAWATSIALPTAAGLFAFLLLVIATGVLVTVDILALDHRPPNSGHRKYPIGAYVGRASLRQLIAILRRH